jgi:hypothetical protein
MPNRGKMVIVGIVLVALAAASFSAWYHYQGQQRAQQFWGTTSAVLIAGAPEVELMRLGEAHETNPDESDSEPSADAESAPRALEFGDLAWKIDEMKDAAAAKGINNVRRALVQDTTFDWRRPADESEPHWQYAIGFTDNRNWATVLFDLESARVALTGGKQPVALDRSANEELKQFFAEQFAAQKAAEPGDTPAAHEKPVDSPGAETSSSPAAPATDTAQPEAESK